MRTVIGIMIAKGASRRLEKKNSVIFCGRPLFEWNLEKLLKIGLPVHFDSDDEDMLGRARIMGAIARRRPDQLCGHDVPSVPIFQDIVNGLSEKPEAILNVQANSPNCSLGVLEKCLAVARHVPFQELLTVYPDRCINGSIWGFSLERLFSYGDPYVHNPDVLIVDESIDIHTAEDMEKARNLFERQCAMG
jgi:CMP-N-acetylneuraminic acid synthetase